MTLQFVDGNSMTFMFFELASDVLNQTWPVLTILLAFTLIRMAVRNALVVEVALTMSRWIITIFPPSQPTDDVHNSRSKTPRPARQPSKPSPQSTKPCDMLADWNRRLPLGGGFKTRFAKE